MRDALIHTAQQIYDEKGAKNAEGAAAGDFLNAIDDEAFVQLGMLADVGDENMVLVRWHDNETFDKSRQANEANKRNEETENARLPMSPPPSEPNLISKKMFKSS